MFPKIKFSRFTIYSSLIIFGLICTLSFKVTNDHGAPVVDAQIIANNESSGIGSNNSAFITGGLKLPQLFSKVQDSVVQVTTTAGDAASSLRSGLGSGFIYDKNGHIITNYHVVALAAGTSDLTENNIDIVVTFRNGTSYNANLVGSDPFSDIAVLHVENVSASKLTPILFGNSSQVKIGEQVIAIGNPFGLSGTMTVGVVSGLGRTIPSVESPTMPEDNQRRPPPQIPSPFDDLFPDIPGFPLPPSIPQEQDEGNLAFSIPDIIQTDAAINPGNSGGPLINTRGEVIGMNTAIFSTTGAYAGIGFAIPSNTITKVVPSLISTGSYEHTWLGVSGVDITPDIAEALGLSLQEAKGFLVIDVNEGSPADKAGIRGGDRVTNINGREIQLGGDVILKIDNQNVRKIDDILAYLERETQVGDTIQLTVLRDGRLQTINVTLAARPGSQDQQQPLPTQRKGQRASLGISGVNVTPEIARAMNLTQATGFLVVDIIAEGPAAKAGLRGGYVVAAINGTEIELGGDVIVRIDNRTVNTIDDILSYLDTKKVGDLVELTVLRDGRLQTIDVTLTAASILQQQQEQPMMPDQRQQPIPDEDDNSRQQIPDDFFNEFYDRCTRMLGTELCNPLFGR